MGRLAFSADAGKVAALSALKAVWWSANGEVVRRLARPGKGEAPKAELNGLAPLSRSELIKAWREPFLKDVADVRAGLYPASEHLAPAPAALARALDFLIDATKVDQRRRSGKGGFEVRESVKSDAFPAYYRQNFHFQTDGWLSDASAGRYEAQVEALFSGTAGAMRRRALSLLAKALKNQAQRRLVMADIACGSGAFLQHLEAAFPRSFRIGLDLSEPYLRRAGGASSARLVAANVERLPFSDASLDVVTCIYLFHELPPRLRAPVAAELARGLKPGGLLAFADSVQVSDAPGMERLLRAFPAFFHEPYFETYQATDLTGLFAGVGLIEEASDQAFLTKARLFRKI